MKNKRTLGSLLLLLTAMIWGMAFVAQRAGTGTVEPFSFVAARMALSAVMIGPPAFFVSRRKVSELNTSREEKRMLWRTTLVGGICCGFFLGTASMFQQAGIVYTTAGKAGFITALYILLVPVLELLLFHRKHGWSMWTAVAIGVAGLYLLCVNGDASLARGDVLVCGCAILFSGQILCCSHFARRCEPLALSAVQFAASTLIAGAAALVFEQPSWEKVVSAGIPILYCGIVSGGIGYTLQMIAQRYTEPAVASLLMSLESVFAVLAGALLLGERMSGREMLGCVVMFAAILLVQFPNTEMREKTEG